MTDPAAPNQVPPAGGEPQTLADSIRAMAARDPSILESFGGQQGLDQVIAKVQGLDTKFQSVGGVYFHLGSTPQETAQAFTQIHVDEYRDTARPSLPALVAHHLDEIGLSHDSPHYKAAILVATRAEVELATTPQYHNKNHYADVTAQVAEFLKKNNELAKKGAPGAQPLTPEEMADSITAAVGHDLDHPGGTNADLSGKSGPFNPLRLEEQSFKAMEPLLKEAGLDSKSIDDIHVMIQTTSPDGPHAILKEIARLQQEGAPVDWDKIPRAAEFPQLRPLADNPALTARAAMLEDADLGASAFEGLKSNIRMSEGFTDELRASGQKLNLLGPNARKGFSDFVVGGGPASVAAQDAVGANYKDMYAATVPEAARMQVLGKSWREAGAAGEPPALEFSVKEMNAAQVDKTIQIFAQAGFKAERAANADGPTLRIEGDDVARLRTMQADLLAHAPWQAVTTEEGLTARLSTKGLGADQIQALAAALQSKGLEPFSELNAMPGSILGVGGNDAAAVLGLKQDPALPPQDSAPPPQGAAATRQNDIVSGPPEQGAAAGPEKALALGVWKDATSSNGAARTRIETTGMSPEAVSAAMAQLKEAGFNPQLRDSKTLGQTISLSGEDALKLQTMRQDVIKQAKWETTTTGQGVVSRVATGNMSAEEVKALTNALQSEGITATARESSTLGPTLRVTGEDMMKVMKLQHPEPAPPPLPPARAIAPAPAPVGPNATPVEREIAKAQGILHNWDVYAPQIAQVRKLEMGTMYTPRIERDRGYYRLPALQGYQQIINAYQLLGNVTPQQSEGLSRVTTVLEGLQQDQKTLGDHPSPDAVRSYSATKMAELESTGETYMLSGHRKHFNITKITKRPDGNYTYTLYDAGHESKIVKWEGERPIINAVQENLIKPGTDIRQLIEDDVAKKGADSDSAEYKALKKSITGALKDPPVRVEQDYGQRKGNCTTRGQRILAADILKDPTLSEGLYDFASNVAGTSTDDIRKALESKVKYLESIKDGAHQDPSNAWRGMDIGNFIKASDPANFESVAIPLDGGGRMAAYRTKPGLFGKDDLDALQGTLERNGVSAAVRESAREPGKFYLYVPEENAGQVAAALAKDASPVADLYRKYGANAESAVTVKNFVKAADPANYENATIGQQGGGTLEAYRTKPGLFTKGELDSLQGTLSQNGVTATVKESVSQRGQYYLYVRKDDAPKVGAALARDNSPAADLVRRFGANAEQHLDQLKVAPPAVVTPPPGSEAPRTVVPPPPPPPPPAPAVAPEKLLGLGVWKDARSDTGAAISRIETKGMAPEEVTAAMSQLKAAGFSPVLRDSQTMGQTIRLAGEDALRLQTMRKEFIGQAKWVPAQADNGALIARVATGGMSPEAVKALDNSLQAEGITPAVHKSASLGTTLRVTGPDAAAVIHMQADLPAASSLASPVLASPPVAAPPPASLPPPEPLVKAPPAVVTAIENPPPVAAPPPPPAPLTTGESHGSTGVATVTGGTIAAAEEGLSSAGRARITSGVAAFGIVQSLETLHQAYTTGDKVEGAIGTVNLGTSIVSAAAPLVEKAAPLVTKAAPLVEKAAPLVTKAAPLVEDALPAIKGVTKFVPGLNVATIVVDGVYQVSKEDTRQHKEERAVAVGTTAAVSLGVGVLAEGAVAGIVTTGVVGTAAVVAAPVVITAVAAVAVAKTGEAVIETKRAFDDLDQQIADSAKPVRRDVKLPGDDGKPSIYHYMHIGVELSHVSRDMKDDNLNGPVKRTPDGTISLTEQRKLDMRDPKNIAELDRVLQARIDKLTTVEKANESHIGLPAWARIFDQDSVDKMEMAKMDLASLQAAQAELQMYKKELNAYNDANPSAPAPGPQSKFTGGAGQPSAAAAPAATSNDPPQGTPVSLQRPPKVRRPVAPPAAGGP